FAPPGELDTLTGPLSVSTTARQARQSAPGWDGHAAGRQQRDRGEDPTDPMHRAPVGRGWPRHDRLATDGGNTDDLFYADDRLDDDRLGEDRYDTDNRYETNDQYDTDNRYEANGRYDSHDFAPNDRFGGDDQYSDDQYSDDQYSDDQYGDERWSDSPAHGAVSWERGSRFAGTARVVSPSSGASFAASRMPTTGRMPVGPRRGRPAPAAARDHAPVERVPGAHRAPLRRGNGRVRLAAAGTVSLAGLSALVAGVAFGGDGGAGGTAVPNAGEAPRIQYTGGTEAFAYGAAQPQASRDRALSSPPRAELAPSADQAGTGSSGSGSSSGGGSAGLSTVALSPTTAPIPIISLLPRDQPATGPTDLRSISPSTGAATTAGTTATSAPTTTATPSESAGSEAISPAASPATAPTATGSPGTGSLPFHPAPIDVEPLLGSWFNGASGAATTHGTSTTSTVPSQRSSGTPSASQAAHH
ncbi:hypothetical protein, partial [Frankia tisae]|uniref:hypothetical protein n=1 Tax=Frankia tisae TaxID=2950104 RepID=UPI0021C0575C